MTVNLRNSKPRKKKIGCKFLACVYFSLAGKSRTQWKWKIDRKKAFLKGACVSKVLK